MIHRSWRIALATIGLAVALRSPAHAGGQLRLKTRSMVPDPDGYVYCEVVASSKTPIGIIATILSDDGTNMTEFGYGGRWSPKATADGRYYAEETAGSMTDTALFCEVTVVGAHRKDVHVSLTAFDVNGNPVATVEAK
jgi:hypothetical protein